MTLFTSGLCVLISTASLTVPRRVLDSLAFPFTPSSAILCLSPNGVLPMLLLVSSYWCVFLSQYRSARFPYDHILNGRLRM